MAPGLQDNKSREKAAESIGRAEQEREEPIHYSKRTISAATTENSKAYKSNRRSGSNNKLAR
jgi:hypothetical protein